MTRRSSSVIKSNRKTSMNSNVASQKNARVSCDQRRHSIWSDSSIVGYNDLASNGNTADFTGVHSWLFFVCA